MRVSVAHGQHPLIKAEPSVRCGAGTGHAHPPHLTRRRQGCTKSHPTIHRVVTAAGWRCSLPLQLSPPLAPGWLFISNSSIPDHHHLSPSIHFLPRQPNGGFSIRRIVACSPSPRTSGYRLLPKRLLLPGCRSILEGKKRKVPCSSKACGNPAQSIRVETNLPSRRRTLTPKIREVDHLTTENFQ